MKFSKFYGVRIWCIFLFGGIGESAYITQHGGFEKSDTLDNESNVLGEGSISSDLQPQTLEIRSYPNSKDSTSNSQIHWNIIYNDVPLIANVDSVSPRKTYERGQQRSSLKVDGLKSRNNKKIRINKPVILQPVIQYVIQYHRQSEDDEEVEDIHDEPVKSGYSGTPEANQDTTRFSEESGQSGFPNSSGTDDPINSQEEGGEDNIMNHNPLDIEDRVPRPFSSHDLQGSYGVTEGEQLSQNMNDYNRPAGHENARTWSFQLPSAQNSGTRPLNQNKNSNINALILMPQQGSSEGNNMNQDQQSPTSEFRYSPASVAQSQSPAGLRHGRNQNYRQNIASLLTTNIPTNQQANQNPNYMPPQPRPISQYGYPPQQSNLSPSSFKMSNVGNQGHRSMSTDQPNPQMAYINPNQNAQYGTVDVGQKFSSQNANDKWQPQRNMNWNTNSRPFTNSPSSQNSQAGGNNQFMMGKHRNQPFMPLGSNPMTENSQGTDLNSANRGRKNRARNQRRPITAYFKVLVAGGIGRNSEMEENEFGERNEQRTSDQFRYQLPL